MADRESLYRGAARGASGFALGAVVVLVPVFVPITYTAGWLATFMTIILGGLVAGGLLRAGSKTAVAFGIGFLPSGFMILMDSVAPQAMSRFDLWREVPALMLWGAVFLTVTGAIGLAVSGLSPRVALACVAGFAVSGAIGGLLYGVSVASMPRGYVPLFVTSVLVRFALSGAVAGAAFAHAAHRG